MATVTRETEPYLEQFAALERERAGREPEWLRALRRDAIARFVERGFPTTKDEEWKYTSVAPITRTRFRRPEGRRDALSSLPPSFCLLPSAFCLLAFVDGSFVPELSNVEALPRGVWAGSLGSALLRKDVGERPSADTRHPTPDTLLEVHLGRYARPEQHPFVALNTALMGDGAFVHVPRGVVVETPIQLLFLTRGGTEPVAAHPRGLIVMGENSQATIVESYGGWDGGVYFTNVVTEIVLAENAVLDHYRVQQESEAAFHVATLQVQQERSSNFRSHAISLGAALARNDFRAVLGGEGIETTLNGLYVGHGTQHVDHHTVIDHAMPHCNSHELYKGILDDRATGVFSGKIFVRQDAQKTDAKQTNQNLLLSRDAVVDTKPQLEIFADDVRCTHGATVGQLDEEALFYLRSRGIGVAEARGLLIYAFASDILNRIQVEPLRAQLEAALFARLPESRGGLRR